jgi:GntR family transcriptional regulator/MocR family aminotransferase
VEHPLIELAASGESIVARIAAALRSAMLTGRLRVGDPVPSTRALAEQLSVSRSSVVAAYDQLVGEGYLDARQGARTRVALHTVAPAAEQGTGGAQAEDPAPSGARIDLVPGRPSTARIDHRAWRAAFRRAAAAPIPSTVPAPLGEPELREAIADHIRHARGVLRTSTDIVITAGTSDAAALLGTALRELRGPGVRVAIEDPGYTGVREILRRRGVAPVPIPVTVDGFDVDALHGIAGLDAAMLTPSHQYPLGGRLPVTERLRLIGWAGAHDAYILEDDYDSEFRHTGAPLPAMASLDSTRVVLVGSLSKVLTPSLRLGYLALPRDPRLRTAIEAIRAGENTPVPVLTQHAVADLLAGGAVRRGIAAARRDYGHRRALVLEVLDGLRGARLRGLDGGLHGVLILDDGDREPHLVAELARRGVAVAALSDYAASANGASGGLVFGYAAACDLELMDGLRRMRAAIEEPAVGRFA